MDATHETLRRIALLLLGLAILAERAGSRCHAVRCAVLSALRPAEAAASALAEHIAAMVVDSPLPGSGARDAARLAQAFRALAILFFALASQARRPVRRRVARQAAAGCVCQENANLRPLPVAWRRSRAPPADHDPPFFSRKHHAHAVHRACMPRPAVCVGA